MFRYYRRSFRDLLLGLKELQADSSNTQRLQNIQDRLYRRIIYIEQRIRTIRCKAGKLKAMVRHSRQSREDSKAMKAQIAALQFTVSEYQWLLYIFRLIGDGLAYTYFCKWDIKPLSFREPAGFLSGKRGCRFERHVVREANDSGVPAIQTDLTNCLRHGDVCFYDGLPHLVEVKSGSMNARGERQIADIQRMSNYLRSDVANDGHGTPRLTRVALHSTEINHVNAINKALLDARVNQHGYISPETGLHYMVARTGPEGLLSSVLSKVNRPVLFWLNDMKNRKNWSSYYPFTLSFQSPDDIIDFIEGNVIITVIMDETIFAKHFASRGYSVRVLNDRVPCVEISRHSTGAGKEPLVRWSMHFVWRVAFEFTSLAWMINEMISQYEASVPQSSTSNGEASYWT